MTLATLSRSPPFRPSPARARVAQAAAQLQAAIDALYEEDKARARERERARQESDAKAKRLTLMAEAREATRGLRVEVPTKFFWDFSAEALDAMRELAAAARRNGEQMRAQAIEARVDGFCGELDKIQRREAREFGR